MALVGVRTVVAAPALPRTASQSRAPSAPPSYLQVQTRYERRLEERAKRGNPFF